MATPIAHYKYGYDSHGNIARSIDIVAAREYNYQYEDGKLIRATEAMVEFTNEMVTSKVIVNSIQYYHNAEDMPPVLLSAACNRKCCNSC